jgi:hypothetical protein
VHGVPNALVVRFYGVPIGNSINPRLLELY